MGSSGTPSLSLHKNVKTPKSTPKHHQVQPAFLEGYGQFVGQLVLELSRRSVKMLVH